MHDREHKGRDQQDDAGAGGRHRNAWWKGGRGKGQALERGVASSLTDAVSADHDRLDGVTRRPLSQRAGTAAESQPGESPQGSGMSTGIRLYPEPHPMVYDERATRRSIIIRYRCAT